MNRKTKRFWAVVCAITMVVTSMTGFKLTNVVADTTTTIIKDKTTERDALLVEVANADYNFALGKDASVSQLTNIDGGSNLGLITNGKFTTGNSKDTIIEIGRGNKTDVAWVQVDLGKAYDTSKIDRIAVQYKTNGTSPRSGYTISYSLNGIDFVSVAEVGAYSSSNNQIYLDKITLTAEQAQAIPYAKYVRVTSKKVGDTSAYGMQVKGMAVLTDGVTKVSEVGCEEVKMLDDPASLTVTSSDFNKLEYSFEAAPEDDGTYVYIVYINGVVYVESATPGTQYVETGMVAGDYTVKVVAMKDNILSEGIEETVTVNDTKSLLTSDRNLAIGKTAKASSIRDTDKETNITDGKINTQFRTVTSDTESNIVIDLAQNYRLDAIERVVGFYLDNRYPTEYTVEFSLNGTDYETVATAVGDSTVQTALVYVSACTIPAVRYVRFNFSKPYAAGYGFQMYELGVIAKEDADLTPVEVAKVNAPAAIDVEVTGYNTADVTITAGEGQEDYKYNIYIDEVVVMVGVDAGTYTITDIAAGEKVFTVKSAYNGVTSDGISVTKTVKDAITYSSQWLAASVVEGGKTIDPSKTVGDVTYNNYSLFKRATAIATSQENDTLVPTNVLDGDNTTRWASQASDPQWIVVDLGDVYDIYELDIVWQTASAKDFDIEYSVDGKDFTKIASVKGAATGSRYENIVFSDVASARYLRIYGKARTGVYGYSIWDMGIYGPDVETTAVEVVTDNNETYYTLADAITSAEEYKAANPDKDVMIKLTSSVLKEEAVELGLEGPITLDLNGYTLETEYVVIYEGSSIIDSSEENAGLLVVDKDNVVFDIDNKQLPVWNGEDGYVFVEVPTIQQLTRVVSETENQYIFLPHIEKYAHEMLLKGKASSGVSVNVRVNWLDDEGNPKYQDFIFDDENVSAVINSYANGRYGYAFRLTLRGNVDFSTISYNVVIKSKDVEISSDVIAAVAQ